MSTFFEFGARPIDVTAFGITNPGVKRSDNQDSFLVADLSVPVREGGVLLDTRKAGDDGHAAGRFPLGPKGSILLVADGMGGAAAGGVASEIAVTGIFSALQAGWVSDRNNAPQRFATHLREAVEDANARIHERSVAQPELQGMGTTTTAVGLLGAFLYLAHVGDSRAYLVRRGTAFQLTRDQSVVQELMDAGELTAEQAESFAHRNMILQALGTSPEVAVDLTYQEVRRGDVVLLCSDGLSGLVRPEEMAEAVRGADGLDDGARRLVETANARGGPDNITVVVARLDGEGLEEPTARDAVGRNVYPLPAP